MHYTTCVNNTYIALKLKSILLVKSIVDKAYLNSLHAGGCLYVNGC